jgi:hypothetical protein
MKFSRKSIWIVPSLILGLFTLYFTVESSLAQKLSETKISMENIIYLPLTGKSFPLLTPFGVQIQGLTDPNINNLAQEAGIKWVRIDAFDWSKIEPLNTDSAGYNWNAVDEATLQTASNNGMEVIAIIRGTPSWAQKVPPYSCGPISETALPDFASFVSDLVNRYSVPPYNITYWQMGNEPDVDPSLVLGYDSVFGCWGDSNQAYYGGEYYSDMLNLIYPTIKSADPDAKVIIGGLLQDCDPTFDQGCITGKFFEGIIRNDIYNSGNNFDYVSFHGYSPYSGPDNGLYYDEHNPKWEHRGRCGFR